MAKNFGKNAAGRLVEVAFPLTPALSLGEREPPRTSLAPINGLGFAGRLATIPPLPRGEGRGEGEPGERPETASDLSNIVSRIIGRRKDSILRPRVCFQPCDRHRAPPTGDPKRCCEVDL